MIMSLSKDLSIQGLCHKNPFPAYSLKENNKKIVYSHDLTPLLLIICLLPTGMPKLNYFLVFWSLKSSASSV